MNECKKRVAHVLNKVTINEIEWNNGTEWIITEQSGMTEQSGITQ